MVPAAQGGRVLAVDDDPKLLSLYRRLLSAHGFEVVACEDPLKVVPQVRAEAFDLVLLDIRMPGLEGTDLLPLIKKVRPDVPVVIISAYCDSTQSGYYHSLGAHDILSKPFDHDRLVEVAVRAREHREHIPVVLTSLSLRTCRDQVYRKAILAALMRTDWNQARAAELLGVSRYCLMRWIKRLGLTA